MVEKKKLKQLINLNVLDYTNQTYLVGKYDLPYVSCPDFVDIDYLALYSEVRNYLKTDRTAVCFYQYDKVFDGVNGLYNAIYYHNEKLLTKYKERFKFVKYIIAPDYSECGDVPRIENLYRLFKSRIVANWLLLECNALAVPNITYADENYFDVMLDGMEECEVVAFSIKGCIKNPDEKELLLKAIRYTVDKLIKLKKIIVYSVLSNDSNAAKLFAYATSNGIKVIIPSNLLKERNNFKKEANLYGKD